MKFIRENLANFITISRVVLSILLFQLDARSIEFITIYTICGISDVLDGTIARLLKTTSRFGSIVDSVSDLIFYFVLLIKIWPSLQALMPIWMWVWFYLVIALRGYLYVYVGYNKKHFLSNHTIFNKLSGFSVFMFIYTLNYFSQFVLLHLLVIFIIVTIAVFAEMKLIEVNKI